MSSANGCLSHFPMILTPSLMLVYGLEFHMLWSVPEITVGTYTQDNFIRTIYVCSKNSVISAIWAENHIHSQYNALFLPVFKSCSLKTNYPKIFFLFILFTTKLINTMLILLLIDIPSLGSICELPVLVDGFRLASQKLWITSLSWPSFKDLSKSKAWVSINHF